MMNFSVQSHGAVILRKAVDLFYINRYTLPSKDIRIIYTLHDEIGVVCPTVYKNHTENFMVTVMQDACRYYFPKYDPPRIGFK